MKITIYDVAEQAGVSIATVSKVINNTGRVSEKTRLLVQEVMIELNYQPNVIASALMGKQTRTIGLLIPDLVNPFFAELARRIEDRGNELDYNIIICNTDYQTDKEDKYISLLIQKRVDGFILASGFENSDKIKELNKKKIPVAIVARDLPVLSTNTVSIDDFMGGYLAANHLIELGHTNMNVIARDLWSNRERLRGFKHCLEESHLQLNKGFNFVETNDNIEAGREMGAVNFTLKNRPTAIFACNDLIAMGVMQIAKDYDIEIPKDMSVIGFDNTFIADITEPKLSTIAQPIKDMGREAVDLMISIINGLNQEESRKILLPYLVERETTRTAKTRV